MSRSPARQARLPAPRPVSQPHDRDEQEARRAADVVARGGTVSGWSFAAVGSSAPVQRQEAVKEKTEEEKKEEAVSKTVEALQETPPAKALREKVLADPLVKTVKEAVTSTPGLIVGGAAVAGGVAGLAAAKKPLPFQPPEIPLEKVTPGLSAQVKLEGPVNSPTFVGLTLTYKEQGPKGKKTAASDKIAADIARLEREQELFKPEGQKQAEKKQEQELIDAWIRSQSGLPGLTVPLQGTPKPKEEPAKEEEELAPVQPEPASPSAEVPAGAHVDDALASPGRPLDPRTRRTMEARFGRDFSRVRIHDDARAAARAEELHAAAFTLGEDIAFAPGRYDPAGGQGGRLLAHELAHVVQQSGRREPDGAARMRSASGRPLDPALRAYFEPKLELDLGGVRIHTGADAEEAAGRLGARAYTVGSDVVFGKGEYRPDAPRGRWLLAHELAHVAQARRAEGLEGVSAAERDASAAATAALAGAPVRLRARRSADRAHRFGEPDNVPDLTFVATSGTRGFLDQAVAYHQTWGLAPQRFGSMQQLLATLAGSTGTISRLRIVSHADFDNIFTPLFAGGAAGITEEDLLAWAESDVAGLRRTRGPLFQNTTVSGQVLAAAAARDPATWQAFGLDPANPPTAGPVSELLDASVDLLFIRGAAGLPVGQRATFETALTTELGGLRAHVAQQVPGGAGTGAQALQDSITSVTGFNFQWAAQPQAFVQAVGAATAGIAAGFRANLEAVRARLTSSSWIDVRGCRVGQRPAYLAAVARFFGTAQARPNVSGPDWFQSFPRLGWQNVDDRGIARRAGDGDVQAALAHWSEVTGIHARLMWWLRFLLRVLREDTARRAAQQAPLLNPPSLLGGLTLETDPLLSAFAIDPLELPRLQEPTFGARRPAGPALLGGERLQNPLVPIAERELARYATPDGELRYYLDAGLPLPVQAAATVQQIFLLLKVGREREAIDAWLASQWSPAAPGLAALQSGSWSRNQLRQVEAVVELDARRRATAMFVSPDPRYAEHIKRTS